MPEDALIRVMSFLQAGQVLAEACRQAAALTSAEVALAVCSGSREREHGTEDSHVLCRGAEDPGQIPPSAARAAMMGLQTRLAEAPVPISAEPAGPGLSDLVQKARREEGLLWAVPLRHPDGTVQGVLAVVSGDPQAASRVRPGALGALGRAAEAALSNAQELASARRHQERLLLFSESSNEAIWDWNPVTQQIWWAAGIQALVGPAGPGVEPTLAWKMGRIHPEDALFVRRALEEAAGTPGTSVWKAEYRFLRADGSWAWVEDRAHFLRDREGRARRVVGAMRDISGLKESNQRLLILAETSRQLGRAVLSPDRLHEILARIVAESLGDSCTVRMLSGDGSQAQTLGFHHRDPELNERLREAGRAPSSASEGVTGQVLEAGSVVLLHSDDQEDAGRRPALLDLRKAPTSGQGATLIGAPISFGGKAIGVLICTRRPPGAYTLEDATLLQDLADRAALALANARKQEEIRDREERLRLAVEAARLGTWELFPETLVLRCDARSRELLLLPGHGQVSYERLLQSVLPDHRPRAAALLAAADEGFSGAELRVELCVSRGGAERWVEMHARSSVSEILPFRRLIGTVLDVTEHKHSERLLTEAVRARDEFLFIASHELRTPLTPLQLQLETLQRSLARGQVDDRVLGQVDMALRQMRRLSRLVGNLLDVSRFSGGILPLDLKGCDLNDVAREVVDHYRDDAARVGSRIELALAPEAAGIWDRSRLEQVVSSLLSNAVKYGPGQPIVVTVSSDADGAGLTVADRGIGIDAQDMARIFRRFERAVSPRHYGGLGLGLYIARRIVEAHGGEISAAERSGGGSVFTLKLPRRPPREFLPAGEDQGTTDA